MHDLPGYHYLAAEPDDHLTQTYHVASNVCDYHCPTFWLICFVPSNASGELDVTDVRHLKRLEQENARLKKILTERDLEIEVMKEVAAKKW